MTARQNIEELFEGNRRWAAQRRQDDPQYFRRLARGQRPPFLYIGCADSRVAPDTFLGVDPGSLFVKRNIANLVRRDDLALESVITFAVTILEVEHVIVCGHTGCGGVTAAITGQRLGRALDAWLEPLAAAVADSQAELEGLDGAQRIDRMVALNAVAQTRHLMEIEAIQQAWNSGRSLSLHAWVFGLETGLVRELATYSQLS